MDPTEKARLFRLVRDEDESGVSGTGHVADGVIWHDGTCTVHWRTAHTSTTVYRDFATVLAIHGHGGKTRAERVEHPYEWGFTVAVHDQCENCPFASVGGLDARSAPVVPDYVPAESAPAWLSGYLDACRKSFGPNWQTCEFGWFAPGLTIRACPPPCEHSWDGPTIISDDGRTESAACSRCGVSALDATLLSDESVGV